jgi:hypothetical protein
MNRTKNALKPDNNFKEKGSLHQSNHIAYFAASFCTTVAQRTKGQISLPLRSVEGKTIRDTVNVPLIILPLSF